MKRGISFFLVCSFLFTFTAMTFSGCAGSKNTMQVSEWLYLINQKFGFSQSIAEEPYNSAITQDNPYYSDVQLAYEYSVLPSEYTELDLDKAVTREFCAVTLAGAVYIPNLSELSINDSDKLTYPEQVTTVINDGIMSLDKNGKFEPQKKVSYTEAVESIQKAYDFWSNYRFQNKIEGSILGNVVDFGGIGAVKISDDGSYCTDTEYISDQTAWLEENNFVYNDDGTIFLNNIEEKNIVEGSVLTIPGSLDRPEGEYRKVTEIIAGDDGSYVLKTTEADLDEIFSDDYVNQGTIDLDFSDCIIYGPDGSVLSEGRYGVNEQPLQPMSFSNVSDEDSVNIKKTIDKSFDLGDGIVANVHASGDSISVSISVSKKSGGTSKELVIGKDFNNMSIIHSIPKNLKKGYLKLGLKYDCTDKITFNGKSSSVYEINDNKNSLTGEELQDYKSIIDKIASLAEGNGGVNAVREICSVRVLGGFAASFDLSLQARFSAQGTVEIAVEYAGMGFGIEKRENSFNVTQYHDRGTKVNSTANGSVKFEGTVGLNLAACLCTINMADVELAGGLGAKLDGKLNAVRHTGEQNVVSLYTRELPVTAYDTALSSIKSGGVSSDDATNLLLCMDIRVYPIVRITVCSSSSKLAKLVKSAHYEKDILGENSGVYIINQHAEQDSNGFRFTECTVSDAVDDGLEHGDGILIDPTSDLEMNIGDTAEFELKQLPVTDKKYYTLSDITVESSDNSIVLAAKDFHETSKDKSNSDSWVKRLFKLDIIFDAAKDMQKQKIIVTAVKEGDAVIYVKTNDGLISAEPINIHVNTPTESSSPSVDLKTYSAAVAVGDSIKLTVTSIAGGKDENFVFWECDDESVAHVDPITGKITGIAEGSCVVKAYVPGYEDNAVGCLITVTKDHTSTNVEFNGSGTSKQWIKIEGQPVIILERA